MKHKFTVTDSQTDKRLDVVISIRMQHLSRSVIQRLIKGGAIRLNGKESKPSERVHAHDEIEIELRDLQTPQWTLQPWDFPVQVLFEDDYVIAVNKPAHVVTHPGAGNRDHTIAHAVLFKQPCIANVGHPLRPGVLHRLDKETSGVLLFAKSQLAYLQFSVMFKERKMEKHYRAFAFGKFDSKQGKVDKALGRDPHDRKKMSVRASKTRTAITYYTVLQQHDYAALLDVRILTGRTHQIRVHLASENHPIVGDTKYGGANWNRIPDPQLRAKLKLETFFGLHALSVDFDHPITGDRIHIEAPLPEIWNSLRPSGESLPRRR